MVRMVKCVAIIRGTNRPCGCNVSDDGNRCGKHGGLTRTEALRLRRQTSSRNTVYETSSDEDLEEMINELQITMRRPLFSFGNNATPFRSKSKVKVAVLVRDNEKFYCGICCEDVDSKDIGVKLKCCDKSACHDCLQSWIDTKPTCPYCRTSVVS
jgi:hypothetical protein